MNDYMKLMKLVDVSSVRTDVTSDELKKLAALGMEVNAAAVVTMPCLTAELKSYLDPNCDVMLAGVAGFPSGADTTSIKVMGAKEMLALGCDEIDMVMNVGALKSGHYDVVRDDMRAVVEACGSTPVKSILEIAYLTDDEIKRGSQLAVEAGITFVKTGTGWAGRATTPDVITLIRDTIGDAAQIKAAGGVKTLEQMIALVDAGVTRFGIGINSVTSIYNEIKALQG